MDVNEGTTRRRVGPVVGVIAVVAIAATLVALTLRTPDVPKYSPTRPEPRDAGRSLAVPILYTVDATASDTWRHFSFRLGAVIDAGPTDWDLAFRRHQIIANGGAGFLGEGGIIDLGPVSFEATDVVPATGYLVNQGGREHPTNPAITSWYSYGFFSHVLTPKPNVWAVRTADGRYAKLQIVSYYCTAGHGGCLTFRYVYQGDGTPRLTRTHRRRRAYSRQRGQG